MWKFREAWATIAFCFFACLLRQGNSLQQMQIPSRRSTSINYANAEVDTLEVRNTILADLRSKTLKDLKLICSRRSLRYCVFSDKEDFVQAVWKDMEEDLTFSASGALRPGKASEITGEQLEQEINGGNTDTPILLDVYSPNCGPCKMILPEMDTAATELGKEVRVAKLDASKYPEFAARYEVAGLPTILVIKNGHAYGRLEGAYPKDRLIDLVRPHVNS